MASDVFSVESFKKDPQTRKSVIKHSQVSSIRQLGTIFLDWACILSCAYLAMAFPPFYLFAVIIIAAKQHALLVIMHEGAHFRIFKNTKLNDFVSDAFASYPILFSTLDYRNGHLPHHRYTNTDQDPDWVRKASHPEWQFPQSKLSIAKTLGRQIGMGGVEWVVAMVRTTTEWRKAAYWVAVLGLVSAFGVWKEFLLFWMVPLMTFFPLFQRIRSIAEHFGLKRSHELNSTRNILAHPVETFFFSPHNVNYHLAHHMFPSVPYYNLKSLHEDFCKHPVYRDLAHNNSSFFITENSVWRDLQTAHGVGEVESITSSLTEAAS
jgi:fatty acid desaturase